MAPVVLLMEAQRVIIQVLGREYHNVMRYLRNLADS